MASRPQGWGADEGIPMNKAKTLALILIGLSAFIAVLNHGSVRLHLIFFTVSVAESILILACVAVGVLIGLLLK